MVSIYSYTISVSGLESYSTDIYLDGAWKTSLKNGESFTFAGLSGTHTISVSEVVSISSGVRLFCSRPSITVSSSGSYTFQYKKQYYLKIISNFGSAEGEGWYDEGSYAYARLDKDEFPAEDIFHVYRFVCWSRDAS
ncbi:MAG: hypothetical protein ACP5F8_03755, partial [Candidatus Aenigmatarchaeota archaeon]